MADKRTEKPVTDEIATTSKDLDIFAGWLKRLENPDPVLRTEAGGKGLKLYDEVDRDPHAGAVLQTRALSVVGKEWEIIPAESTQVKGLPASSAHDKEIADFVAGVLENCNFEQARREFLEGLLYGYKTAEVLWKYDDGAVVVDRLMGKHPRRFSFTMARELRLLTPQSMIEGEEVPERKFIVFTYGDSDNPYGKGLGRKLWWPVWFKKHGIRFWLVFLEKYGMPTAVGKYPAGTPPAQQQNLLDAIDAIQNETGVKIPDTMAIDLLEATRSGNVTYEKLCDYMDRQISKAVLGQTLTTEIKGEGSYAASKTHDDVRQELVEADADLLDECLNNTLVRWIVDYNFPGVEAYPKLVTHAARKPDLKERSEIDRTVVKEIGVPVSKTYFYETYGIPEPADDEETVGGGAPAVMPLFREYQDEKDARIADELLIEKERQKFVGGYLATLSQIEGDVRADALERVVTMLEGGGALTEAQFCEKVYGIMETAYTDLDRAMIREPLKDCYAFYRLTDTALWGGDARGIGFTWGTRDERTLDFLTNIDRFHLGKFIRNDDMKGPVWTFLKEQYGEHGAALYGRTSPEVLARFRDLFSDRLGDLTDMQIRRICDTSVARMRGYGTVEQLHEAGVEYAKVVAVLDNRTSAICAEMDGKIIPVAGMYDTVTRETAMTPEDYIAYLKTETPTVTRAEGGEAIPPYHPHCRTRLVYAYEEAV